MPHPNRQTDPDCTNPTALEAALEIKIAAETYAEVLLYLAQYSPTQFIQASVMRTDIEKVHQRITEKYTKLRGILKET